MIYVMDKFMFFKRSANKLGHYKTMFRNIAIGFCIRMIRFINIFVSFAKSSATARAWMSVSSTITECTALRTAFAALFYSARMGLERLFTVGTSQGNHSYIIQVTQGACQ